MVRTIFSLPLILSIWVSHKDLFFCFRIVSFPTWPPSGTIVSARPSILFSQYIVLMSCSTSQSPRIIPRRWSFIVMEISPRHFCPCSNGSLEVKEIRPIDFHSFFDQLFLLGSASHSHWISVIINWFVVLSWSVICLSLWLVDFCLRFFFSWPSIGSFQLLQRRISVRLLLFSLFLEDDRFLLPFLRPFTDGIWSFEEIFSTEFSSSTEKKLSSRARKSGIA